MVTIKLWGGIGNQLFQYAYGYQIAQKTNAKIALDISWFAQQNLREPEILKLGIKYDVIEETWKSNKGIRFCNNKNLNRLLRLFNITQFKVGKDIYLKETRFKYCDNIAAFASDNCYLDGYWQCPRYFDDARETLVKLYKVNDISNDVIALGERLKAENSVAVHVRMGDYPDKKKWYSRLKRINEDYYKKAIDVFEKQDVTFYLFSNDIEKAKEMLTPILDQHLRCVDMQRELSGLEEWYLISCCQHQIIGNSTFSWWAAYLNENTNKIVVAPNGYMGNDDIVPSGWITIGIV